MARARARRHGWPAAAAAGRCGWQPKERAAAAALALMAVALATAALLYALAPAGDIPASARVSHRTSLLKPSPKYKPWEANRAAVIHACTLPRVSGEAALTDWRPGDAPAVLVDASDNSALREATRRQVLLAERGDATVKLASSDTWSTKQIETTLSEYVLNWKSPQPPDLPAIDALYLFDSSLALADSTWAAVYTTYAPPKPAVAPPLDREPALSFGIAPAGSGVQWHVHGPALGEALHGRKRWLLYPPHAKPDFEPYNTTGQWLRYGGRPAPPYDAPPIDCTVGPGEAIYVPDMWWHATFNVDDCVFMSTFP